MPLNILFIRHGQTQGNLERRYIGSTDQPLCPEGREALAGRQLPPVNQIYTSPLLRCRETASLLFPSQPFEVVEDFRECDFGAFENHTYEELKDDPAYQLWLDTAGETPPPGGESKAAQKIRTLGAFHSVVSRHSAGTIALVVHGGTIMTILESLEPAHEFYRWQAKNGCGWLCAWDGRSLTVISGY